MQNTWMWRWEAFKLRARPIRKGPQKAALSVLTVELIKVDYHQDKQPPITNSVALQESFRVCCGSKLAFPHGNWAAHYEVRSGISTAF